MGSRWVVSAQPKMLTRLRPVLGGTIRQLGSTGPERGARRVVTPPPAAMAGPATATRSSGRARPRRHGRGQGRPPIASIP